MWRQGAGGGGGTSVQAEGQHEQQKSLHLDLDPGDQNSPADTQTVLDQDLLLQLNFKNNPGASSWRFPIF